MLYTLPEMQENKWLGFKIDPTLKRTGQHEFLLCSLALQPPVYIIHLIIYHLTFNYLPFNI